LKNGWAFVLFATLGAVGPLVAQPAAPVLVSPSGLSSNRLPTYTWNVTNGAKRILPVGGRVFGERAEAAVPLFRAVQPDDLLSGPSSAPPYGARFRLRPDFPLNTLPNEAARVVARALQRHGMFLADGGNVALTAQSDRFTTAKWSGLLGSRDLQAIQVSDFQMVDGGERLSYTGDCVRVQD